MDNNIFCEVSEAIEVLQRGEMLIVTDDENRENEGDFLMAAQYATPEKNKLYDEIWTRFNLRTNKC